MMKLIKKHSGGGWLKDKAGKDRIGYWDYSDSNDPNIQKKIARYYINFEDANVGDTRLVQTYLNQHPVLATFLDEAYQRGIDWDKQKNLGNDPQFKYLEYKDSKGNVKYTDKANNLDQYAKSLGYTDYNDFLDTLRKAGYSPNEAGTQFSRKNANGTWTTFFAAEDPGKGIRFVDGSNKAGVSKQALAPRIKALKDRAKKEALASRASANWAKTAKAINYPGRFYDNMINAGYTYNSKDGTYEKGNYIYTVDAYGNVRVTTRGNSSQPQAFNPENFFKKQQ